MDIEESPNTKDSALDEDEMNSLEAGSMPDSTKRAMRCGVCKFTEWLDKRGKVCDFATIQPSDLAVLLRNFYAEVKANLSSFVDLCVVIMQIMVLFSGIMDF